MDQTLQDQVLTLSPLNIALQNLVSLDSYMDQIEAAFIPSDEVIVHWTRFSKRKQKTDETPMEFFNALLILYHKAKVGNEFVFHNHFLEGLINVKLMETVTEHCKLYMI